MSLQSVREELKRMRNTLTMKFQQGSEIYEVSDENDSSDEGERGERNPNDDKEYFMRQRMEFMYVDGQIVNLESESENYTRPKYSLSSSINGINDSTSIVLVPKTLNRISTNLQGQQGASRKASVQRKSIFRLGSLAGLSDQAEDDNQHQQIISSYGRLSQMEKSGDETPTVKSPLQMNGHNLFKERLQMQVLAQQLLDQNSSDDFRFRHSLLKQDTNNSSDSDGLKSVEGIARSLSFEDQTATNKQQELSIPSCYDLSPSQQMKHTYPTPIQLIGKSPPKLVSRLRPIANIAHFSNNESEEQSQMIKQQSQLENVQVKQEQVKQQCRSSLQFSFNHNPEQMKQFPVAKSHSILRRSIAVFQNQKDSKDNLLAPPKIPSQDKQVLHLHKIPSNPNDHNHENISHQTPQNRFSLFLNNQQLNFQQNNNLTTPIESPSAIAPSSTTLRGSDSFQHNRQSRLFQQKKMRRLISFQQGEQAQNVVGNAQRIIPMSTNELPEVINQQTISDSQDMYIYSFDILKEYKRYYPQHNYKKVVGETVKKRKTFILNKSMHSNSYVQKFLSKKKQIPKRLPSLLKQFENTES